MVLDKPYTLSVFDIIGDVIYTKTINPNSTSKYKETVDLINQANGVYTIQVTADGFNGVSILILLK